MNSLVLRRFLWKESRQLAPVLVTLGVLIALLVIGKYSSILELQGDGPFGHNTWIWYVCSGLCGLAGLCLGVTLFSTERENGTERFLSNFPIPSRSLAIGKLVPGLAATALFSSAVLLVLYLGFSKYVSFYAVIGMSETYGKVTWLSTLVVLPAIELFLWGALFSVLLNRTIPATVMAMLAYSIVLHLLIRGGLAGNRLELEPYQPYADAWPLRIGVVVLLMVANGFFAGRWARSLMGNSMVVPFRQSLSPTVSNRRSRVRMPIFKLVWQTIRHSSWTLVSAVIGAFFAIGAFAFLSMGEPLPSTEFVLVPMYFTYLGICVFWNDQRGQSYLFFQQHAEYGRWIWLTRMLVWFSMFMMCFIAFGVVSFAFGGGAYLTALSEAKAHTIVGHDSILHLTNIVPLFSLCLGCFGIGQLFSMFIRSAILGPFFAVLSAYGFTIWCLLMFAMYIGFWWTVLPLGMMLILATFLHSPHWISGQRRVASQLKLSSAMLGLVLVTIVGICFYRASEVPRIGEPIVLPASARAIKAESVDEFYKKFEGEYSDVYLKWIVQRGEIVYQDDIDLSFQYRDTVARALDSTVSYQQVLGSIKTLAPSDGVTVVIPADHRKLAGMPSLEEVPDDLLDRFVERNQAPYDLLMSVPNPSTMVPILITNGKSQRSVLTDLMLLFAEHQLRNGKLLEAAKSVCYLKEILPVLHYRRSGLEIGKLDQFMARWLDHPDLGTEALRQGGNYYVRRNVVLNPAVFYDLENRTNEELSQYTGHGAIVNFPSERIRSKRLNLFLMMRKLAYSGRVQLYRNNVQRFFGRNYWMARWADVETLRWRQSSPGVQLPKDKDFDSSTKLEYTKLRAKLFKSERGRLPSRSELFYGWFSQWEYQPDGLDGDLYLGTPGVEAAELIVPKGTPFLMDISDGTVLYQEWRGKPRPMEEPWYAVELEDGTTLEASSQPSTPFDPLISGYPNHVAESRRIHLRNGEVRIVPSHLIKKVTNSRFLGDGEKTYVIYHHEIRILTLEK